MKVLLAMAAGIILFAATQPVHAQANKTLSNLNSPLAINQSLLPDSPVIRDLGADHFRWRNMYLGGKIGIRTKPVYPIDITNKTYDRTLNIFSPTTGEEVDRYGVYASSVVSDFYGYGVYGAGGYTGVYGYGNGGANVYTTVGVYGFAYGTSNVGSRYGVYGFASGGFFNAAGYFSGAVYALSYNSVSDRKFKTNITALKTSLELLLKLKPSTYEFNQAKYANMGLPEGKQIGLIADEVKQVFPEVVNEAVQPAQYGKDKSEVLQPEIKYESVNYIELIPVLIASIQQQQKIIDALRQTQQTTIDALQAKNDLLEQRLSKLEKVLNNYNSASAQAIQLSSASLEAAIPNPSSGQTIIGYYVPQKTRKATIEIADMKGVF